MLTYYETVVPEDIRNLVAEAARDNVEARHALSAIVYLAHAIDDVYDGDVEGSDALVDALASFFFMVGTNLFFRQVQHILAPVLSSAALAWGAATRFEEQGNDIPALLAASVLKSSYTEAVFLTAYLLAGAEHERALRTKYNQYDFQSAISRLGGGSTEAQS